MDFKVVNTLVLHVDERKWCKCQLKSIGCLLRTSTSFSSFFPLTIHLQSCCIENRYIRVSWTIGEWSLPYIRFTEAFHVVRDIGLPETPVKMKLCFKPLLPDESYRKVFFSVFPKVDTAKKGESSPVARYKVEKETTTDDNILKQLKRESKQHQTTLFNNTPPKKVYKEKIAKIPKRNMKTERRNYHGVFKR
jgi:hypothetical protein